MPVPTETFWNTRRVSLIFAVSGAALLASLVWMVKVDYARPWREHQEHFVETQRSLARFDMLGLQTPEAVETFEQAKASVETAQRRLESEQATLQRLADAIRAGGADATKLAGEVIEQIDGAREAAFVARAQRMDRTFGEAIEQQTTKADASVLAKALSDPGFSGKLADLLDWFNLARLESRYNAIRGEYARAELDAKNLKSDKGVLEAAYEHLKALHGESHAETREAKTRVTENAALYAKAKQTFDRLADERAAIEAQQRALQQDVTQAQRALARIEKDRNDAAKRYQDLSNTLARGIFNLPLMDFAAPKGAPGRNEIRQVVLPDVRTELNFLQSYTTDRCMTCHVAIDDKTFTKENLAKRLERAIIGANEEFRRKRESLLTLPTVPGRDDLEAGRVAASWRTLSREQQETFFAALVKQVNKYQARHGEPELQFGQPLLAHPDLSLYISPDSPHPMSRMGCTSCHDGNGEETDFVLAAHTPKSREERRAWEEKYYVRSAGVVPEIDFETAEHHWTRPMLVPKYSEASCTKCHAQVADIAMHAGEPAARTINEGQMLFTTLGCINCHLVEQFADSRKVGPDLSHLAAKATPGFVQNWVYFPADYRPSTQMPHFFNQENNDARSETTGGDASPDLRTRAEVVAMTQYLMRVSTDYPREAPPRDLWDASKDAESEAGKAARDRGRRLFGAVGCMACHANLAYRPNDENNVVSATTLGQQWITGDLTGKIEALARGVQEARARQLKAPLVEAARKERKKLEEVSIKDLENVGTTLAIVAQGEGLALPKLIEIVQESFTGSPIAGRESATSTGKPTHASGKATPRSGRRLAGPHYDAEAALRRACKMLLGDEQPAAGVALNDDDRGAIEMSDEIRDAMSAVASEWYGAMDHLDRVEYAMANFPNAYDTLFDPDVMHGQPVFTRFAPELSSIGTKFADQGTAVAWLYDWLRNPRHYSDYTKMPSLRLHRGQFPEINAETGEATGTKVDADEALDLALYLADLKDNATFSTRPFDADANVARKLAERRDESLKALLGGLNSAARSQAILNDEGGELSEQLIAKLTRSLGEAEARARIEALNLEERRWMFLGDKMIGHYGCYACHQIRGYETAARPGTELTSWGEKQLTQIDFAFFDPHFREEREKDPLFRNLYPEDRAKLVRWAHANPREDVEHTLASFAWHKVRNPRMWDRRKGKGPYDKLKMPNFFLTDRQADALVTFLLSRRPARINKTLQADYEGAAGKVARGRNLARELNCVACHKIDGNAAVVHQFFQVDSGGELVFDEINAPPWLRGQGAKIQADWLYGFLNNVEMLRPWLRIRMPSFHLTQQQSTQLVEYFFGLSQQESKWLRDHLAPVDRYVDEATRKASANLVDASSGNPKAGAGDADESKNESAQRPGSDWFQQDWLAPAADALRRYAVRNRLATPSAVDPSQNGPAELSSTYEKIYRDASALHKLYNVSYPFPEPPVTVPQPTIEAGDALFTELKCLACHVFGDPTVKGANSAPTAPNLQLTHQRLRRTWVDYWLESPQRLQPGTKMPNVFGQSGRVSAFKDYPPEAKQRVAKMFHDAGFVTSGDAQIEALISFLYDAGQRRLDKVLPPAPPPVAETQPAAASAPGP